MWEVGGGVKAGFGSRDVYSFPRPPFLFQSEPLNERIQAKHSSPFLTITLLQRGSFFHKNHISPSSHLILQVSVTVFVLVLLNQQNQRIIQLCERVNLKMVML